MVNSIPNKIRGENRVTRIGDLQVDAVMSRVERYTAVKTDHVLSDKSVVSDHHYVLPVDFSIEGYIVKSPLRGLFPGQAVFDSIKAISTGNTTPQEDAKEQLIYYIKNSIELDITTPKRTFKKMLLLDVSFPERIENGDRLYFEVACSEIKKAKTKQAGLLVLAQNPKKQPKPKELDNNGKDAKTKQAKPKVSEGKSTPTEATGVEETKLRSGLDRLAGVALEW